MAVEELVASEQHPVARRLIDEAVGRLPSGADAATAGFARKLFAQVEPDDLGTYSADELAGLAARAWEFLRQRKPGRPKIRVEPLHGSGHRTDVAEAVLEIVNDDMPFLFDSVLGELQERGLDVSLVAHPTFLLERDPDGRLVGFVDPGRPAALRESFIHVHVRNIGSESLRNALVETIESVLGDVRLCVQDWRPMLDRLAVIIAELKQAPASGCVSDRAEAVAFLEWLAADNFTFFGMRDYAVSERGLEPVLDGALGLLKRPELHLLERADEFALPQSEIRTRLEHPRPLIIAKASVRSRVHRRTTMDYVAVRRFDPSGGLLGETRIGGLFTSTAYTRRARDIPYLRDKVDSVLARAGFDAASHSGKALVNVLDTYPRDELFQIDAETLYDFALAILRLDERPRVRVLPRRDRFDRFVSILVFVPRERYGGEVRRRIGEYLAGAYFGHVSAYAPFFPEGPLVRVHFIIGRAAGNGPDPDRTVLERDIGAIIRTWIDGLSDLLQQTYEPVTARTLLERYRSAFSAGYREIYSPATAAADIDVVERLTADRPFGVDFHHRDGADLASAGLKVWSRDRPIPLSERVPILENMGFRVVDEQTYQIGLADQEVWLHDMTLERQEGGEIDLGSLQHRLEACLLVVMGGVAESDGYNALVLAAGMPWRDAALIRAISRYLRQARIPFSQDYLWTTLRKHSPIASQLVTLFHARFDPRIELEAAERASRLAEIAAGVEAALQDVDSLDEDRILRRFLNAITSAVRTNYYQIGDDGQPMPLIAFKFDSRRIDGLPLPRPLYEIFVYSPRVEGAHLRFGKVARGGIRWSDRPQDFRTEVLGLVKAQQVKNAVIVPVGAKGGFVPKRLPVGGTRDAIQAEGIAAYRLFISTLLDLTDNLSPDGVIPPPNVVRHDSDDPYLVVAADKGTATFSDIANEIAVRRGFWLGDAFASGGSAGYDHKKIGITARGAWESVKRHFRELNVDVTRTPFTVAGVGDMSGDVFGNGMLRERTIRLVAAFDHRDIFIDPEPDPDRSYAERRRLFEQPRSSWQDYDRTLLSPGGGVFSRTAKAIPLSPEIRALLGLDQDTVTPPELIRSILTMPVDLLWFGGIGTYIRASAETDDSVGDRNNDPVRVTAAALRCKVIGEGANLGMTQRGRIEAALRRIRLNTDAIDNSAGVNTSDMEVNIKIALSGPMRDGRLSFEARNALLGTMTDDVAGLVLRNNYLQPLAISLAERRGLEDLGFLQRLMQILEARGELDRALEFLPDDIALSDRRRASQGMTRPELAVLLAYAKLSLKSELLESTIPDDPYLGREVGRYFPKPLRDSFPEEVSRHRLRREIIATQLANSMINRGGPSLVVRIADQTGAAAASIASAFAAVRDSFQMTALNGAVDALDSRIASDLQLDLYAAIQDLLLDRIVWFLRNVDPARGLVSTITHYETGISAVQASLDGILPPAAAEARTSRRDGLIKAGVPADLATRLANLPALAAGPDIVLVSERTGRPVREVGETYFAVQTFFHLDRIGRAAEGIVVTDYFDRLAMDGARDRIGDAERRLTAAMLATGASGNAALDAWVQSRVRDVERVRMSVQEIVNSGLTISKLAVAAGLLSDLPGR